MITSHTLLISPGDKPTAHLTGSNVVVHFDGDHTASLIVNRNYLGGTAEQDVFLGELIDQLQMVKAGLAIESATQVEPAGSVWVDNGQDQQGILHPSQR